MPAQTEVGAGLGADFRRLIPINHRGPAKDRLDKKSHIYVIKYLFIAFPNLLLKFTFFVHIDNYRVN